MMNERLSQLFHRKHASIGHFVAIVPDEIQAFSESLAGTAQQPTKRLGGKIFRLT